MTGIAKWFVRALAATAQRDPISDLVGLAVRGFHGDTASHPDGAHVICLRINHQPDRRFQSGFNGHSLLVPDYQPSRGAVAGLFDGSLPGFRIFGFPGELPDASCAVAETGTGAQILDVGQQELGPINPGRLRYVGLPGGLFLTIESDPGMTAVTKGFVP